MPGDRRGGGGRLELALALKRSGDLEGALVALEAVVAAEPANARALAHLAHVQLRRRRYDEAAEALGRAESASGPTAFSAQVRGDIAFAARRYDEAARAYEEADAHGAGGTWCLTRLARSRLHAGDLPGARGAALRAVERAPDAADGWVVLGEVALREGQVAAAQEMFAKAHAADPANDYAYAKLVEARLSPLGPDAQVREVEVLLKTTAPGNAQLRGLLARLRAGRGEHDAGVQEWRAANLENGSAYSRRMHAFALRKAGRLDEAAAALASCLAEDPANVPVFRSYVATQRERGSVEELCRTLEALLARAGARRGAFLGELRKAGWQVAEHR